MTITQEDMNRLNELNGIIQDSLQEAKDIIKDADQHLYERWHAYGEVVSNEFVSECTLDDVCEKLADCMFLSDEEDTPH